MRQSSRVLCWMVLLCCLAPYAVCAQEEWRPPEPSTEKKDWIQLVSGEWLSGDVKQMRDLDLTFDSDELDEVIVEWRKITEMRSGRRNTYVLEDGTVLSGTSAMRGGQIAINTGLGVQRFARNTVLSIIEGEASEKNFWSALASLGLVSRAGNTDQVDLSMHGRVRRTAPRTRLSVEYFGNWGELDGEVNINNHRGSIAFDVFLSKTFFVTPALIDIVADKFQNIELRTTLGAAGGIHFIRKSTMEWDAQIGGGYQRSEFVSVGEGEDKVEHTGTVIPATSFEADITKTLEVTATYDVQVAVPDVKNAFHNATGVFSIEITSDIDLDFSFTWTRVENPKATDDGVTPERDDFRTSFGFSISI